MKPVRFGLTQTAWTGDQESMVEQQADLVSQAAEQGATLVLLQEFSIGPYFAGVTDDVGFSWAEPLRGGPSDLAFSRFASDNGITVIGSIYEIDETGEYWDTATVHGPSGTLEHYTRKVHIPSGEGYYETHFFGGYDEYPVHDLGSVQLAAPTCYDQWFPELARIYALEGAELICYPTAIGAEPTDPDMDSQPSWETVMRGHAIANGVFVAAANRVGEENGIPFYGSSFVCAPSGEILARASRTEPEVLVVDLEPSDLDHWRELFPLLHQRRPDTYNRITGTPVGDAPDRWQGQDLIRRTR
ncbi:MAG: nitrilase-related carbon-nitrogen hydrolase [Acidimicrobiia bacterium]|nr:nitrilase-related carbon-nitrogen hydrolase [Acidimicrobiia bacterium]